MSTTAPKTPRGPIKADAPGRADAGAKPGKAAASAETRIRSIQKRFSKSLAHLAK